jgi:hypothetical protein
MAMKEQMLLPTVTIIFFQSSPKSNNFQYDIHTNLMEFGRKLSQLLRVMTSFISCIFMMRAVFMRAIIRTSYGWIRASRRSQRKGKEGWFMCLTLLALKDELPWRIHCLAIL